MIKPFRYSGNKTKHMKHLLLPAKKYTSIVEPYAGSMIYSLNSGLPAIGYDTNPDLCDLWWWLSNRSEVELLQLDNDFKSFFNGAAGDLRDFVKAKYPNHPSGLLTYLRINTAGIYTGQLSGYKYYPQHKLPISDTITALPAIKNIKIICGDAASAPIVQRALYFIDPPYINTAANYKSKSTKTCLTNQYNPADTLALVNNLKNAGNPIIFTYGDGAQTIFPGLPWQKLFDKKVPNIRKGGTVDRTEWVCYL